MSRKLVKSNKQQVVLLESQTPDFTPITEARDFLTDWYNDPVSQALYNQHQNQYELYLYDLGWLRTNNGLMMDKSRLQSSINAVEAAYPDKNTPYKEELYAKMDSLQNKIEKSKEEYRELSEQSGTLPKEYSLEETNKILQDKISFMLNTPYGYYDTQEFAFPNGASEEDYQKSINYHNNRYNYNDEQSGLWDISNPAMTTYRSKAKAVEFKGHEDSHNMLMDAAEWALGQIFKKYGIKADPHEGMSWLSTDRVSNGIKPDDRSWTPERVKLLRQEDKGNGLMKHINNDAAVSEIYNLISKADSPTLSYVTDLEVGYAKRGKKLIARRKLC